MRARIARAPRVRSGPLSRLRERVRVRARIPVGARVASGVSTRVSSRVNAPSPVPRLRERAARRQDRDRADQRARSQGGSVVSHNPSRDDAARPRTAYAISVPSASVAPAIATPVTARASDWRVSAARSTRTSSPLPSCAL